MSFRDDFLGFIFYKYLSERMHLCADGLAHAFDFDNMLKQVVVAVQCVGVRRDMRFVAVIDSAVFLVWLVALSLLVCHSSFLPGAIESLMGYCNELERKARKLRNPDDLSTAI